MKKTANATAQNRQLTVQFHNSTLNIVEHDGQPFVSAKQIALAIGLDWKSQYNKLNKNRDRWGMVKRTIPSTGGNQSAVCLPLRKLPGWLATIQANKVSNELRPTIIKYQNECDDVLWAHWEQTAQQNRAVTKTPTKALAKSDSGTKHTVVTTYVNGKPHTETLEGDIIVIETEKLQAVFDRIKTLAFDVATDAGRAAKGFKEGEA